MLLTGYTKEIFRPEQNHSFESLHCYAHLNEDISCVIPYLNTVLGGTAYQKDPPSVMFLINRRLIAVHSNKIAVNALKDEEEADRILKWLQNEINQTWKNRDSIDPSYVVAEKPKIIEVLKLLPKTNCKKCGQPTCMVFSTLVIEGVKGAEDCPEMDKNKKEELEKYLSNFKFTDS